VSNPLLGVTLAGGAGNDVYEIHRASDVIVEQAGQGTDTVRSSVSLALADNVENLSLTGVASINATGNALGNLLAGNAGDNVLDGLGGVDTASYAAAYEAVTVDLASADVQDTGGAGLDTLLNIENLVGSAYDDTLLGNDGANTIDGGAGADLMMGGLGNDTYVVNHEGDQVLEYAAEGTDTVRSNLSYTLGTGLEDLVLLGTANKNGTGNGAANVLTGNRGNNVLDGGLGTDTASYANALSGVRVGLDRTGPQSTSGAGVDTLISIENLTGSAHADTLHGNAGTNVLNGGAGVDTLSYARAAAAVTVDLSLTTAQATGGAGLDTVLLFENLTGSTYADTLSAGAGNNLIDGGAGADTMTGGAGNDTYVVDNTLDTVVEVTYGGTDTVISSVTYKLSNTAAENLTLTGSDNINATGNALSNVLTGNAGANVLNGGGGSDTANYAGVATSVTVNLATGLATGGGGSDSLISIENVVTGSGADGISGSDAANVLNGGAGNDSLTGGLGADTFVFDNLMGADAVTDFISGSDVLRFHQGTLVIGNGDASVDGGVLLAAAGGFAVSAELVIFSANIAGAITSSSAATAIGSASSAYAIGDTALFVVDNGTDSALYRFRSSGADAFVSGSELTHVATLVGNSATALADYVFAA
jgi:Ca2+-binding RTX toxin-like protein